MRFVSALLSVGIAIAMLSGCDGKGPAGSAEGPVAVARKADSQLAYEHEVTIEGEPDVVTGRFKTTRDACNEDKEFGCTLIRAGLVSTEAPEATLVMRIAPGGVAKMLAVASVGGRISRHETTAEDLAVPVADADRQLAMLTRHRTRLEELQSRRDLNFDQLIKLSQELAQVQTNIENLTAHRSQLQKRIDTELLTIELRVPAAKRASLETPVRDSFRSFWSTMGRGFADTIDVIATGLPWLIFVAIPLLLIGRFLWRWSGRRTGG